MRHLSSLKLARALPDPDDSDAPCYIVYRVFGCVQSKDANLDDLPQPAVHRFAVINPLCVSGDIFQILEAACELGALSPVKLMDVSGDSLYIFLDAKVGSTTFAAIESLWSVVTGASAHRRMAVNFASESEIYSGRSDYVFWRGAKEVLESEALGLTPDVLPAEAASTYENDRPEVIEAPRLQSRRDGILIPSSGLMYSDLSDLLTRSGHRGKNMTERKLLPETLTPIESYLAWISKHTISGLPRSKTAEYCCQRKARAISEYELKMLTRKKEWRAKAAP